MIIQLTQNKVAIVDDADFEYLSQWKWYLSYYGYAVTTWGNKKIYMHRLLLDTPKGMETDHINSNRLDNRRANLRVCTHANNQKNMSLRKDNTSGVKGVRWHKQLKKWNARIHVNGKEISLGCYHDIKEATKAYNKAAMKYHKEFASLNEKAVIC